MAGIMADEVPGTTGSVVWLLVDGPYVPDVGRGLMWLRMRRLYFVVAFTNDPYAVTRRKSAPGS